ncbi:hypothetical protein N7510_009279 [Penicillium lagena]|uniref:uncharacterized protein n=1 Tax=Penicillium lagena TaxID=94218 RepID=UPI002540FF81|nr:uncharacterized protein N7510_009279 [Penicillium lagena]KAJ5606498.1 hypothetical protein N7510_009279 [Penicillium lagena]
MALPSLLRATLPLRPSIASFMSPARSQLLPRSSILTPTIRSASTITSDPTPSQETTPPTQPTTSSTQSSSPITPADLTPPSRLRTYASVRRTGTVTSVGRMDRTVRVSFRHRAWDRHIRKHYPKETHFLVSDPNNSLREGDVIEFSSGAPKSRRVHHVVERIVAPFGTPIEERRPVLSREERDQERERKWAAKYLRREERRLGGPVDLAGIAGLEGQVQAEGLSDAELIHRIHGANERIGRVKRLVLERTAAAEAARVEAGAKARAEAVAKEEPKEEPKEEQLKYE